MRFVQNYVAGLVVAAGIGTGALAYFSQETPLETGHYSGTIEGKPAVLQVKYDSEKSRDCILQIAGNGSIESAIDYLCNDKKRMHKEARTWVRDENKITFDQAQKHLGQ